MKMYITEDDCLVFWHSSEWAKQPMGKKKLQKKWQYHDLRNSKYDPFAAVVSLTWEIFASFAKNIWKNLPEYFLIEQVVAFLEEGGCISGYSPQPDDKCPVCPDWCDLKYPSIKSFQIPSSIIRRKRSKYVSEVVATMFGAQQRRAASLPHFPSPDVGWKKYWTKLKLGKNCFCCLYRHLEMGWWVRILNAGPSQSVVMGRISLFCWCVWLAEWRPGRGGDQVPSRHWPRAMGWNWSPAWSIMYYLAQCAVRSRNKPEIVARMSEWGS